MNTAIVVCGKCVWVGVHVQIHVYACCSCCGVCNYVWMYLWMCGVHLCNLYNFKNVKNTHGGVLILVKLQAEVWMFFTFFKLYKCYQTRNASHILHGNFFSNNLSIGVNNPFYPTVHLLYPLETSENQRFSDVFKGV